MQQLDPASFIIISYETLMTLKEVYLKQTLYKKLRIESDYIPNFENGNIVYVPEKLVPLSVRENLQKDKGFPTTLDIPKNFYEPRSMKDIEEQTA